MMAEEKLEQGEMDDEMEEYYKSGEAAKNEIHRTSSKVSSISTSSYASTHSESSSGEAQVNGPSTSAAKQSKTVETHEIGVQTTLERGTSRLIRSTQHAETEVKEKERRPSTKSKVKKIFRRKSSNASDEIEIRIEGEPPPPKLPQGFIVKYMGKRLTKGMWGSKHTRVVVEDVVDSISRMPKSEDLPLVNLDVYYQGLEMRPHSKNKIRSFKPVQIPIQFISYGIQDTVYPRVFCFIMVKEMSSQERSLECHVYACDSNKNARRIASCLATAFQAYAKHLKGSAAKFSVDIQMDAASDKTSFEV